MSYGLAGLGIALALALTGWLKRPDKALSLYQPDRLMGKLNHRVVLSDLDRAVRTGRQVAVRDRGRDFERQQAQVLRAYLTLRDYERQLQLACVSRVRRTLRPRLRRDSHLVTHALQPLATQWDVRRVGNVTYVSSKQGSPGLDVFDLCERLSSGAQKLRPY